MEQILEAADQTRNWLNDALEEYLKSSEDKVEKISQSDLQLIMSIAYARLLEGKLDDETFPETLKYDMSRVAKLADERIQLSLTLCGVFIASNLAGKEVCEKTNFKKVLKSNLIAILQDVTRKYEFNFAN